MNEMYTDFMKYFFLFPLLAINMIYILYVCQAAVRKHMHGDLIQCFSWKFTDINSGMSRSLFYRDENVRDRAASNCIESQKSHFIYPYAYSRSIIVSVCVCHAHFFVGVSRSVMV